VFADLLGLGFATLVPLVQVRSDASAHKTDCTLPRSVEILKQMEASRAKVRKSYSA
jgi:hypothetical protein